MLIVRSFILASLAICLFACAVDDRGSRARRTIIDHVTVLDGRGGEALEDARVEIASGRIVAVTRSSGPVASGAMIINGRGKFLAPGFIDMHAHLMFPRCTPGDGPPEFDRALSARALSQQLAFGITTVRSPATPTVDGLRLRDELNAGLVRGPRAFASAEFINDASLDDAQLRQVVREALTSRPDYIKVYARLRPSQVAAVVDEAHRHHVPVIGHLQRTSWAQGLDLGIDHLAHAVDWSSDSLPEGSRPAYAQALRERGGFRARIDWLEAFDPDSPANRRLLDDLARRQVSVDVTLLAYDGKFSSPNDPKYRENPALSAFPDLRDDWRRCDGATADWTEDDRERWQAAWPKLLRWVKRMSDAGVLLVSGTDLTNEWIAPGVGLHQEFELLASAGLSPDQILRMTGANAAQALGRDDVGIVEDGRRADLVLLSSDPRVSIANTRSIVWVMQGGRIISPGVARASTMD